MFMFLLRENDLIVTLSADAGIGLIGEGSGGTITNSLFVGSTWPRSQNQLVVDQLNSITRQGGGTGGNQVEGKCKYSNLKTRELDD